MCECSSIQHVSTSTPKHPFTAESPPLAAPYRWFGGAPMGATWDEVSVDHTPLTFYAGDSQMKQGSLTIQAAAFALAALLATACGNDPSSPNSASSAAQSRNGTTGSTTGSSTGVKNGGSSGNSGSTDSTANAASRVRSEIALVAPASGAPFAGAKGKAKWDARSSHVELEIEVEHIPTGTVVTFFVGGTQVGSPMTAGSEDEGEVELTLSTQRGDKLPASIAGLTIEAKTAAGADIVSGKF